MSRPLKVYLARAMSNRTKAEVVAEAKADKLFLEQMGFEVLDPVSAEGVEASDELLMSNKPVMDLYWPRDKAMIRASHVFLNMSPHLPSVGVIREYGYARYYLQKPCVSVFPKGRLPGGGAICYYEDDFVVDNLPEAVTLMQTAWASPLHRLAWRVEKQILTWPKRVMHRSLEWK